MFKIVQYNSITNKNGIIEYNTNVVKVVTSFNKAIEIAIKLKQQTGKLYKVERV